MYLTILSLFNSCRFLGTPTTEILDLLFTFVSGSLPSEIGNLSNLGESHVVTFVDALI